MKYYEYSQELHNELRRDYMGVGNLIARPDIDDEISILLNEIERLQSENAWIPVSERLPEDNTVVIAVSKFGNGQHVFPSWFKDGLFHYQAEMIYECETPVTHWRPLPQPPED